MHGGWRRTSAAAGATRRTPRHAHADSRRAWTRRSVEQAAYARRRRTRLRPRRATRRHARAPRAHLSCEAQVVGSDRKSVLYSTRVSVRVDIGGRGTTTTQKASVTTERNKL